MLRISCFVHKFHCEKNYVNRTHFIYFCTSCAGKSSLFAFNVVCHGVFFHCNVGLTWLYFGFCDCWRFGSSSCTSSLLKSFVLRNVFLIVRKRVFILFNINFCKSDQGREAHYRIGCKFEVCYYFWWMSRIFR